MKMCKSAFIAVAVATMPLSALAVIPGTAGQPTTYEITVTQVELCQTAACSSPYVIGTGTSSFDISSAAAGAEVGSYVDISGIPLFQTWTHVRVTISTTIRIGATWTDGDGDNCGTSNATQASAHAAVYAASVGGAATAADFVIPNVGFSGIAQSDYDGFNVSKANNAATATVTFPLASPYTCKGDMPRIEVQFNTASAFGYVNGTAGGVGTACQAFPRPPSVTITVTDP